MHAVHDSVDCLPTVLLIARCTFQRAREYSNEYWAKQASDEPEAGSSETLSAGAKQKQMEREDIMA